MIIALTPTEQEILKLYTTTQMSQCEIATKIYGARNKQGRVSHVINKLNRLLKIDLKQRYPRGKNKQAIEVKVAQDGSISIAE